MEAREHFAQGLWWLAKAEVQPNRSDAGTYAAIATAHFAAANAAAVIQAAETYGIVR